MVKGVGHLGHDEAMEAGGREFSLHGRVVKGVGHLGHDEAMEAGGHAFDPRPGHYRVIPCQFNKFLDVFPRTPSDCFEIWYSCRTW